MNTSFVALLKTIAEKNQWQLEHADPEYVMHVKTLGLCKPVRISFVKEPGGKGAWARYVADAGPDGHLPAEFCLRLNADKRFITGGIALRGDRLIYLDTQNTEDADDSEVRSSLRYVARFAIALGNQINDALLSS